MPVKTPVVFIIFNRPETTRRVFEAIRKAQPEKLFVIADGPRNNVPGESVLCERTRKIIEGVDWKCKVIKDYSPVNLGCKKRLSSGISAVFEQTPEAVFLEDDCLPSDSFFRYCEELLDRYRDNEKIMHIGGINFQFGRNDLDTSYYFSRFVHVWGWASWRRAWKYYDPEMKKWPELKAGNLLESVFEKQKDIKYWSEKFQSTFDGNLDTWDYQWALTCMAREGLSILPAVNLVSNIGFNTGGVHTHEKKSEWAEIPLREMNFPLKHPEKIKRNVSADKTTQDTHFNPGFIYRLKRKLKQTLSW